MSKERREDPGERKRPSSGRGGGGECGGGSYSNPHSGKGGGNDGFMGHGGQTEQGYYGGDQLGDRKLGGGQSANTPSKKDDGSDKRKGSE